MLWCTNLSKHDNVDDDFKGSDGWLLIRFSLTGVAIAKVSHFVMSVRHKRFVSYWKHGRDTIVA